MFGGGKIAVPGKNVKVCYEGCFPDGRVFDKNNNRRRPLQFRVGEVEWARACHGLSFLSAVRCVTLEEEVLCLDCCCFQVGTLHCLPYRVVWPCTSTGHTHEGFSVCRQCS